MLTSWVRSRAGRVAETLQRLQSPGVLYRHVFALISPQRTWTLPHPSAQHRPCHRSGLVGNAGPEEYLRRAVAFLAVNGGTQLLRLGRVPDLRKGPLSQVPERLVLLTEAHVTVGIDDGAQTTSATRNHLSLFLRGADLRPLEHRFHARAVAPLLTRGPETPDVLVQLAVLLQRGALQGRVLPVPANDGQVVMIHLRAALVEIRRQAADLAHVQIGCGRNGVDPQAWIALLDLDQRVIGLHRLLEGVLRSSERVVELRHAIQRELDDQQI